MSAKNKNSIVYKWDTELGLCFDIAGVASSILATPTRLTPSGPWLGGVFRVRRTCGATGRLPVRQDVGRKWADDRIVRLAVRGAMSSEGFLSRCPSPPASAADVDVENPAGRIRRVPTIGRFEVAFVGLFTQSLHLGVILSRWLRRSREGTQRCRPFLASRQLGNGLYGAIS